MTPDKYSNNEFMLDVGDGHKLCVYDWGKKDAKTPVIFLHGGPGSSAQDKHRGVFDGENQRVIFFDQRGCGKSLPYGSLKNNTTQDMVEDIEKIATHLKLDKFIIHGSSWGSALAFFYAIKYPKRVTALVLSGVWTSSKSENEWLDKGRFQNFFPDVWDRFLAATPKEFHNDPTAYHFKRVLGKDKKAALESAYAYDCLEGAVIQLDDRFVPDDVGLYDPAGITIEMYYLANDSFMPDRFVFNNASKLTMPVWMVQGRYDMVCPPVTAYKLNEILPNSHLIWTTSGHKTERETWNIMRMILLQLTQDK